MSATITTTLAAAIPSNITIPALIWGRDTLWASWWSLLVILSVTALVTVTLIFHFLNLNSLTNVIF